MLYEYLNTLFCEHFEDLLQVDVEAVEERPLGREILHYECGTKKGHSK